MLPENVLITLAGALAGGFIGFLTSLAVLLIRDALRTRERRKNLINAIDAAARSCSTPTIMAAFTGVRGYFSPGEQFLATFWRDLPLLGTYTQMMAVTYFSLVIEATKGRITPSKEQIDTLEELRKSLLGLLESEKKGQRQNIPKS